MILSKKELGALVKTARKLKSEKIHKLYSQQMLANDIGKSQSYIGDIESGRTYPSFLLLNEIADACEVPISFFQDGIQLDKAIDKFIKLQLSNAKDKEIDEMREHIKNDPNIKMNYVYDYIHCNGDKFKETESGFYSTSFETPEEAVIFLLNQPVIKDFSGIDISKMSKEEISDLSNDFLGQLKLISYKYKK